jgi:hypothetical protein
LVPLKRITKFVKITGVGSELFASGLQYVLQNYFTHSEACLMEDGGHFQQFL